MPKKNIFRFALIAIIILLNIGCDQQTKNIAQKNLQYHGYESYLNNTFVLTYAENDGAFLSFGSGLSAFWSLLLLKILPVGMLLLLLGYTLFSKSLDRLQIIALSFILGGGISNIVDRLLYGYVVDFMNMGIGELRTGIFNFADVSIMIGIGIFLYANWRKKPESKASVSE